MATAATGSACAPRYCSTASACAAAGTTPTGASYVREPRQLLTTPPLTTTIRARPLPGRCPGRARVDRGCRPWRAPGKGLPSCSPLQHRAILHECPSHVARTQCHLAWVDLGLAGVSL